MLRTHPRLGATAKAILSSEEAIRQARAAYLPTVKLTGDTGPEYIDNKTRVTTNDGEPWFRNRDTAGLTVTQKLFDGNATDSQVATARLNREASVTTLRSTRQEILLEGATAYIQVKRWTRQVEYAAQKESNIQGQERLEDERVRRGSGIALDVIQAKQRLQRAKEDRVRAEGELENAASRFAQVFGRPPAIGRMEDVDPPAHLIPPSLEMALDTAAVENPTLVSADLTIELNAEKKRLANAGYYPTVDLVGKTNYEDNKNLTYGVRRDWSLLIQGNWEIFSGFKTDAAVAQAAYDHAASKDQRAHAGRKVIEQTKIAWRDMTTARDRLGLLENAVNLAYELVDGMRKQQEAGKVTVREVLDQETALYDAQITYNETFQEMRLAMYRLLWSIGRLEVEDLAKPVSAAPGSATPASVTALPPSPAGANAAVPAIAAVPQSKPAPQPAVIAGTVREPPPEPAPAVPEQAALPPAPPPEPVAPKPPMIATELPPPAAAVPAAPEPLAEAPPVLIPPAAEAPPVLIPPAAEQNLVLVPPAESAAPVLTPPGTARRNGRTGNRQQRNAPARAALDPPQSALPEPAFRLRAPAEARGALTPSPSLPVPEPTPAEVPQPMAQARPASPAARIVSGDAETQANVLGGGLGFSR